MTEALEIIYQDDNLVAINKPNGLLVHRSSIATDATVFAVQMLRDQIGQYVYPVHRLDRKTSGVLLFGLDKTTTKLLQEALQKEAAVKKYLAIVRGYFPDAVEVDYPLTNDRGKKQAAITLFRRLLKTELPIPFGKHPTSRYSLILALPKTGRIHQIRKHCNHLRHPIIGDRPHGCNKQNRLFKTQWEMTTMLLHAAELRIEHPISKENLTLAAKLPKEFLRMQKELNLMEDFS